MKRLSALAVLSLASAGSVHAQGRPTDWPSYGGDAQRTGFEKSDSRITKENVKDFQLVMKHKLDAPQNHTLALTPPVVIGMLISYKGFKELAFTAGNNGHVWSIDADLDRLFWERQLDANTGKGKSRNAACAGRALGMPSLLPPMVFRPRPAPGAASPGAAAPPPAPAAPASPAAAARRAAFSGGFGAARPLFMVAGDGKLHRLNTADGSDQAPPVNFLPANSVSSPLTVVEGVAYTTTSACGGGTDAVWALDLAAAEESGASPKKFDLDGASLGGLGGFALGTDGTVYLQTGPGQAKYSNSVLALDGKDLNLKQFFTASDRQSKTKTTADMKVGTPVVFSFKGRDLVVSSDPEGRLYLLDSASLGAEDHKTPLSLTEPLTASGNGIWGGLSSWADTEGTRWVLAPVWGPVNSGLKGFVSNGDAPHGSIVAFRVEEHDGKPALMPAWVSRDMISPEPPVITSGTVFAVSAGDYSHPARPKGHATLYALDGVTGKEVYSTQNQVTAPAALTGMSVANGRVFFATTDNILYGFGVYMER